MSSQGRWCVGELYGSEVPSWTELRRGCSEWNGHRMVNCEDGQCQRRGWHRDSPMSQIETMTWYVIWLWGRIYFQLRQGLWYLTRQIIDAWHTLPISNETWRWRNINSWPPPGGKTGRQNTLHTWPMPLGYRWRYSGAGEIYLHLNHMEGKV